MTIEFNTSRKQRLKESKFGILVFTLSVIALIVCWNTEIRGFVSWCLLFYVILFFWHLWFPKEILSVEVFSSSTKIIYGNIFFVKEVECDVLDVHFNEKMYHYSATQREKRIVLFIKNKKLASCLKNEEIIKKFSEHFISK